MSCTYYPEYRSWVSETACAEYCGVSLGEECNSQSCLPANAAPTATVSISGTVANGQTLTGSYTYADAESDPEGTSTFQWYTGTDANCAGKTAIFGATSDTYTIQTSDVDKFICFGVTPVATSGKSPGTPTIVTTSVAVPANAAPTATVSISGNANSGSVLTGSYTYSDAESDPEGTSTFQWYTGTDANCTGKTAISGSTANTYTIQAGDVGKFVCFGVTPVATAGTLTGTEVLATTTSAVDTPLYSSSPVPGVIPAMNAAAPADAATPLTVSNTGTAALDITGITFTGTDAAKFSVSPDTFPVSIAAAGNRAFTITCDGSSEGTFTATMAVAHNAAGSPANYTLSCTVTTAPIYSSSPAAGGTLTMNSYVPTNASAGLTVTNTGSAAMNITGINFGGANPTKFSVSPNTFPVSIAVGGNRVFTITCNGSAAGTFAATMAVAHDAAGSPADYTLTGIVSVYVEQSSYSPPANTAPVADKLSVCTDGNNPVSVTLSGTDPDVPGMNWFLLLLKPMSYSVVTQPQHGTLSGTPPNMVWTPEPGFSGTDSFTFRAYDGAAYSEPAAVNIGTSPGGCFCVSDSYDINISCAEFQGMRYGATLNFIRAADDPSGLYWKLNLSGLRNSAGTAGNCASVGNDLKMAIPCARYQGTEYRFTLNPAKPGGGDPFMLYWKMDLETFGTR